MFRSLLLFLVALALLPSEGLAVPLVDVQSIVCSGTQSSSPDGLCLLDAPEIFL